jgi:pyridoxine kinase
LKRIPRVAAINDISGFGRCSLTTAIPVLSVLGAQCCPVPTAVLSCHTGFESFLFEDLTAIIPDYFSSWRAMKLEFDAIYSGFLGSFKQIFLTEKFIREQNNSPLIIIDTVMGDCGKIYSTYSKKMCLEMKKLASLADVVTPNVTEACFLTGTEYIGENISIERAVELSEKLSALGVGASVITGIETENSLVNLVFEKGRATSVEIEKAPMVFSGTGDLFASCLTGLLVGSKPLCDAVYETSRFIFDCISSTISAETPIMEGVQFEPLLYKLGGKFYENRH